MINAAIVGMGRWGRRLVDSVQTGGVAKGGSIRFTSAVARTVGTARDYCAEQRLGLAASFEDMLGDASIDAVVLATPHDLHVEQILAVAAAGKHIFVEKPLAMDLAGAMTALNAARQRRLVLAVGHNRRFLPAAAAIRSMMSSGTLGELVHVEGNFCNNSGLTYEPSMWRSNESDSKGAMTAMGVHLLDFFVHLCGPVKSVSTLGSRRAMPVAINDVVRVNLEFENGATGYLSTMLTTPRQWRVQVYGTSGWTHMRDEQVMDVCDAKGIVTTTDFGLTDTLRMELESFADAVEGVGQYPVSGFELVHVPAVLEAVLQSSANSGVPVHIPAVSPDLENSP